jgi:hypothetical protein
MTIAWLAVLYVSANIWLMRILINKIEPLYGETAWLLCVGLPLFVAAFVYHFVILSSGRLRKDS